MNGWFLLFEMQREVGRVQNLKFLLISHKYSNKEHCGAISIIRMKLSVVQVSNDAHTTYSAHNCESAKIRNTRCE